MTTSGFLAPHHLDPLAPVCAPMDVKSRLAQHGFDKVAYVFVVFNDDCDSQVSHGPPHV